MRPYSVALAAMRLDGREPTPSQFLYTSPISTSTDPHLWIRQHGDPFAKARDMVESMRRKGDEEGADRRDAAE
jgi:hypothetical protein